MSNLRSAICTFIIFLLLVGCAPTQPFAQNAVVGTQVQTTLYIAKGAAQELFGTKILANPDQSMFVLARNIGDYWGFVITSPSGTDCSRVLTEIGGNLTTCQGMSCLADFLTKQQGWKYITAAELPAELKMVLLASNVAQIGVTSLTTFLVVPAGMVPAPEYIDPLAIQ